MKIHTDEVPPDHSGRNCFGLEGINRSISRLSSISTVYLLCLALFSFPNPSMCTGVPWLTTQISVSTQNSNNTPTFVDQSVYGNTNFFYSTDLPSPEGDVFLNVLYHNYHISDNLRLYNRYGSTVLNISGGATGMGSGFVKFEGGKLCVIASTFWSRTELNYFTIQPLQLSGSQFSAWGPSIRMDHTRAAIIRDDKQTIYFFVAGEEQVTKLNSLDGTQVHQSVTLGESSDFPSILMVISSLDSVLAWFKSNKYVGLLARLDLSIRRERFMTDLQYKAIQSKTDSTVLFTLQSPDDFSTNIQRRRVADDMMVLITEQRSSVWWDFFEGDLAQLASIKLVLVSPYHTSYWTRQTQRGLFYFMREDTMEVFTYHTSPQINLLRMTSDLSNPLGEDGGRRFYMLLSDAATQNIHSYYFLMDPCVAATGQSLTCSDCPTGYWRASASQSVLRKCLRPEEFPPAMGMNNTTMTYEPCVMTNCLKCTFNHEKCTFCDSAQDYFLKDTAGVQVCEQMAQPPPGFGLDSVTNTFLPCADEHCKECKDSYEYCKVCDGVNKWTALHGVCYKLGGAQLGEVPNPGAGDKTSCQVPGCLKCEANPKHCAICNVQDGWYIQSSTCKKLADLVPSEGVDLSSYHVKNCQDLNCLDCRENHKICTKCNTSNFFSWDGVCRKKGGPGAPRLRTSRMLVAQAKATVEFDTEVRLDSPDPFWKHFVVTVQNELTDSKTNCSFEENTTSDLVCWYTPYSHGFHIEMKANTKITIGTVVIQRREKEGSVGQIVAVSIGEPFEGFPIAVEGFSSDFPSSMQISARVLAGGANVKFFLSLVIATASLSWSIICDKHMIMLEYIGFLGGPVLVFPEQIFSHILRSANIIPVSWLASQDGNISIRQPTDCEPSDRFALRDYGCSIFSNLGPDTFTVGVLLICCSLISLICHKYIQSNAIKLRSQRNEEETEGELISQTPKVTKLSKIMNKPEAKLNTPSSAATFVISSGETVMTGKNSESGSTTTGKEVHPGGIDSRGQTSSTTSTAKKMRILTAVKNTYGWSFLFAKLEAYQLRIMTVVWLNFWNHRSGYLEQYSLIAAIIFTLYYIFQGYFTYQFADQIWREVSSQNTCKESTNQEPVVSLQVPGSPERTADPKEKRIQQQLQTLRERLPTVFSGLPGIFALVNYDNLKVPTVKSHLSIPLIVLMRNATSSGLLVMTSSQPILQILCALIVEIAYLVFIIKTTLSTSKSENRINILSQLLLCIILLFKGSTVALVVGQQIRQDFLGLIVAWLLIAYAFVGFTFPTIEFCKYLLVKLKGCRKQQKVKKIQPMTTPKDGPPTVPSIPGSDATSLTSVVTSARPLVQTLSPDNKKPAPKIVTRSKAAKPGGQPQHPAAKTSLASVS